MSADLDRAVDARVAAHTPTVVPPFEVVEARRRTRHRRRSSAAAAVTALAVAVVALLPSGLRDDGPGGQTAQAPDDAQAYRYLVRADDVPAFGSASAQAALARCLALPGLSEQAVLESLPAQYAGIVTGRRAAAGFDGCTRAVPGAAVSLTVVTPATGATGGYLDRLHACLNTKGYAFTKGPDGGWSGRLGPPSEPYERTQERYETAQAQCSASLGVDERPPPEWTDVEVCRADPTGPCRRLGADVAAVLDELLDDRRPADADVIHDCRVRPVRYTVTFEHPTVKPVPLVVPSACDPVLVGRQAYRVSQAARDGVRRAYDEAAPPSPVVLTPAQQRFVDACVGRERALPAPGVVGLTEAQAAPPGADSAPVRVVGRDGECLGRTDDLRRDRTNIVVDHGRVIWAGRF